MASPIPAEEAAKLAQQVRTSLAVICDRPVDPEMVVTCEFCAWNSPEDCEFAWDLYNTDGSCLAIK